MIGCIFDAHGKAIAEAFHEIRHGLKATFLTVGPTKPEWVNNFDPPSRSIDVLSAAQWRKHMKYEDPLLGSTIEYAIRFQARFDTDPTCVAAGASAVASTLHIAIENAFQKCDISKTKGDVEALLYDKNATQRDEFAHLTGYERIVMELEICTLRGSSEE